MKTILTFIQRLSIAIGVLLLLTATPLLSAEPPARQWFAKNQVPTGKNDDALRKLMIQRYNAATEYLQKENERYEMGLVTISQRNRAAVRVLQAALAISDSPEEQIRIRQQYLELMRKYEQQEPAPKGDDDDPSFGKRDYSRYLRLDAEIRLLIAEQQMQPPTSSHIAPLRIVRRDWFAKDEVQPGVNDGELARLLIQRFNAATAHLAQQRAAYDAGTITIGGRNMAIRRALTAALALTDQPSEQIKMREQQIELLKRFERVEIQREEEGLRQSGRPSLMRALRLDAELQLSQAKGGRLPDTRLVIRDLHKPEKFPPSSQVDPLGKRLVERYNAAAGDRDSDFFQYSHGIEFTIQEEVEATELVLQTALALNSSPAEQVKLRGQYLEYLRDQERRINAQFEAGLRDADAADLAYIRSLRLDAEVELLLAKRKLPAGKR